MYKGSHSTADAVGVNIKKTYYQVFITVLHYMVYQHIPGLTLCLHFSHSVVYQKECFSHTVNRLILPTVHHNCQSFQFFHSTVVKGLAYYDSYLFIACITFHTPPKTISMFA